MKTMGKGSLASFLTGLLNVGWYVAAFALGSLVYLVVVQTLRPRPALEIIIPVLVTLDDPARLVTSPSLGNGEVHIQESRFRESYSAIGFEWEPTGGNLRLHDPLRSRVRGSLRFPIQKGAFLAVNLAIPIVYSTLVLCVLGLLQAIFRTLRDGQPFVAGNAMRLRWIALAVIGGELARAALAFFESYYAMTHFTGEGLRFDVQPDLNIFALINGLIILVIAEVFRTGTRLDEEQSLTV